MKQVILVLITIGIILLSGGTLGAQVSVYNGSVYAVHPTNTQVNSGTPVTGDLIGFGNPSSESTFNNANSIQACKEIRMTNTTKVHSPASGSVHFSVDQNALNIFSYSNTDMSQIKALKKFETGVQIPTNVLSQINSFLVSSDENVGLNPFLEWEVNLVASYHHMGSGYTDSNSGFYFRQFERNLTSPNQYEWGWDELPVNEPFRVRFSFPEKMGVWEVTYKLYVNQVLVYDYCPFYVNVVAKEPEDGYVKVANNNRVLERNGDLFLPVGQNMKYPDIGCGNDQAATGCHANAHVQFEEILEAFTNSGGDFIKIMISPLSFDIEFEKLGNYYDRLDYAYELDRLFEFAEEHNVYVVVDLLTNYQFTDIQSYGHYAFDWSSASYPGYPTSFTEKQYCYPPELGLTYATEWLSDSNAKRYYKQRLRYLLSRYGYSTKIALFELMAEVNSFGCIYEWQGNSLVRTYAPYSATNIQRKNVMFWHKEMSEYIKNTLDDKEHLIGTNYAEIFDMQVDQADTSMGLHSIDVIDYNSYPNNEMQFMGYTNSKIKELQNKYHKPVFFGETGELSLNACDGGVSYENYLWQYGFSGAAGFCFWDGNSLTYFNQWPKMKQFKDWILNDPVKKQILLGDWTAETRRSNTNWNLYQKEWNFIRSNVPDDNGNIVAFGAVFNNTVNYRTNSNPNNLSNCTKAWNDYKAWKVGYSTQDWDFVDSKENLGSMDAPISKEWDEDGTPYDSETNFHLKSNLSTVIPISQFAYEEILNHPYSCITTNCQEPNYNEWIFPFEAVLTPNISGMKQNNLSQNVTNALFATSLVTGSNGETILQLGLLETDKTQDYIANLYDVTGRLICKSIKLNQDGTTSINLSRLGLAKGSYVVEVTDKYKGSRKTINF